MGYDFIFYHACSVVDIVAFLKHDFETKNVQNLILHRFGVQSIDLKWNWTEI